LGSIGASHAALTAKLSSPKLESCQLDNCGKTARLVCCSKLELASVNERQTSSRPSLTLCVSAALVPVCGSLSCRPATHQVAVHATAARRHRTKRGEKSLGLVNPIGPSSPVCVETSRRVCRILHCNGLQWSKQAHELLQRLGCRRRPLCLLVELAKLPRPMVLLYWRGF